MYYNSNDMIAVYYCATHTYCIYYERTHQMHIIYNLYVYNLVFNEPIYSMYTFRDT